MLSAIQFFIIISCVSHCYSLCVWKSVWHARISCQCNLDRLCFEQLFFYLTICAHRIYLIFFVNPQINKIDNFSAKQKISEKFIKTKVSSEHIWENIFIYEKLSDKVIRICANWNLKQNTRNWRYYKQVIHYSKRTFLIFDFV